MSQINVIVPICLKYKDYTIFTERSSRMKFLFVGPQDNVTYWDLPSKISKNCPKSYYRNLFNKISEKYFQKSLFVTYWLVWLNLLDWLSSVCYHYPTVFSAIALPHSVSRSWNLFYRLTLSQNLAQQIPLKQHQQVLQLRRNFYVKWNRCSHNGLCKCTKTDFTMSTNTSRVWKLYLTRSNCHVTCLSLELNIGRFYKHQNKSSNTHRHKMFFFSPLVSIKSNTMKRLFKQRSKFRLLNVW